MLWPVCVLSTACGTTEKKSSTRTRRNEKDKEAVPVHRTKLRGTSELVDTHDEVQRLLRALVVFRVDNARETRF